MIDFHSHILPAIDDGSKDVQESVAMLKALSSQGIDIVVATPHFLSNRDSVSDFLSGRLESYSQLEPHLTPDMPHICMGAEVAYYEGISRLEGLFDLCIGESRLLLLEMPMSKWSEYSVREIINLACSNKVTVVLAHIERYMDFRNNNSINKLTECGVLLQANASFFNELRTRRKALSMLHKGNIHFVGSDCHNLIHRPPCIGQAFDLIRKKSGEDFIQDYTDFQRSLLCIADNG